MNRSRFSAIARCLFTLITITGICESSTIRAAIVYTADPNNSSLTITASLLVASLNGTVTMPIQGGNLTTRLSGVFTATPPGTLGATQIQFTQLDTITGNVFNPAGSPIPPANSIIGNISIANSISNQLRLDMLGNNLIVQNGTVAYSLPTFALSGTLSLSPATLTANAPTFSNGDTQIDFDFATTPLHQQKTISPGVVLDVSVSGHIQGIQSAPEPTTCVFLGAFGVAAAAFQQRKRIFRRK